MNPTQDNNLEETAKAANIIAVSQNSPEKIHFVLKMLLVGFYENMKKQENSK